MAVPPIDTVDGTNPAPVDMVNNTLFTGFHTCKVVQDFFHQQYYQKIILVVCYVGFAFFSRVYFQFPAVSFFGKCKTEQVDMDFFADEVEKLKIFTRQAVSQR